MNRARYKLHDNPTSEIRSGLSFTVLEKTVQNYPWNTFFEILILVIPSKVKRLVSRLSKTFPSEKKTPEQIDLDSIEVGKRVEKVDKTENYHDDEDDDEFGEVDDFDEAEEEITTTGLG